jgi:hypothetical protein
MRPGEVRILSGDYARHINKTEEFSNQLKMIQIMSDLTE